MSSIMNIIGEQLLLSVFLYGLYKVLFENETLFIQNRIYLLGSVLIILTVPFLSFELIPHYVYLESMPDVSMSIPTSMVSDTSVTPTQVVTNYPLITLMVMYVVGALWMLLRLGMQFFSIYRLHVESQRITQDNTLFCIHPKVTAPFSFFNRIYNADTNLPIEVLEHEKVHISHYHTIDNIGIELCKVMMWYNPFLYFIHRRLKEVHEYTCDSITSQKVNNIPAYAQFLLEYNAIGMTPMFVNSFHSQIKKRLMMLKNVNDANPSTMKKYLGLPILLLFFLGLRRTHIL